MTVIHEKVCLLHMAGFGLKYFSYASCVCVCAAAIELDFPGFSLVRQAIYICNSTI